MVSDFISMFYVYRDTLQKNYSGIYFMKMYEVYKFVVVVTSQILP